MIQQKSTRRKAQVRLFIVPESSPWAKSYPEKEKRKEKNVTKWKIT